MTAADFISRLGERAKPHKTANGWQCRCPAHDDGKASLAVSDGAKGVLLHCHAGCRADAVCGAVGVKVSELFNGEKPHRNGEAQRIVASYDYQVPNGDLIFQVVRYEPKTFRQRRRVNGEWVWNMDGVTRVPYHLPEVLKASREGRPVFICEGEKDVDAMREIGFAATCNPGGAGKWQSDFSQYFQGAEVVIIADKDEAGRKHAQDVAGKLHGAAATIRVLELPDRNGCKVKDAHDWIASYGAPELREPSELDELVQAAPLWSGVPQGNPTLDGSADEPSNISWLEFVQDGAAIQTEVLPAVVEIVAGIVGEQSKLVIGSGSKSFKTWLTMDLALSVSHAVPFLDRVTERQRVLYVNLELKAQTFKRRLQAVAKAKGIKVDNGWFLHLPLRGQMSGLTVFEIICRIIALARHFKAGAVIIDPVYKMNVEGDENSSRDQTRLFNELDRITTEAGCTLILNDHFGKGNQSEKDPLDAIRGSSAKGGDVDAAMILRKHEVEDCFRVDVIHRELAPIAPFSIGWKYPLMELRPDLDPDAMKKAKGGRKPAHDPLAILAAIRDTTVDNPISVTDWAEAAGIKRSTLYEYTPGFRAKDWIKTVGTGGAARQHITLKGLTVLKEGGL